MAITKYPVTGPAEEYRITFAKENVTDLIEEMNHRTVKLLETEKGVPLIDEYAVDTASALVDTALEYSMATCGDEMAILMRRNEKPFIEDDSIIFPFIFSTQYMDADLEALESLILDLIVYRTLRGWYAAHDNGELLKKASELETITLAELRTVVRRMAQELLRKQLGNPFSVH